MENVAFAIFYRHDGNGVPFALLPLEPTRGGFCNYYHNWKCDYDFHTCSCNQDYIPQRPCVTGANDAGYLTTAKRTAGFRRAFASRSSQSWATSAAERPRTACPNPGSDSNALLGYRPVLGSQRKEPAAADDPDRIPDAIARRFAEPGPRRQTGPP